MNRRKFLQGIGTVIGALVAKIPRTAKAKDPHTDLDWSGVLTWDKPEEPKLQLIPMDFFTAQDHSGLVAVVYLGGQDVTDNCKGFYGTAAPGPEVEGWVDLYKREDGHLVAGPNGEARIYRLCGPVRWRGFTAGNRSHLILDNFGIRVSAGVLQSE